MCVCLWFLTPSFDHAVSCLVFDYLLQWRWKTISVQLQASQAEAAVWPKWVWSTLCSHCQGGKWTFVLLTVYLFRHCFVCASHSVFSIITEVLAMQWFAIVGATLVLTSPLSVFVTCLFFSFPFLLLQGGSKVACGTGDGSFHVYSWGEWGDISDRVPVDADSSIDACVAVDDRTLCLGSVSGSVQYVLISAHSFS